MEADHRRLDDLWDESVAVRLRDPVASVRLLHEFAVGLLRHIQAEEDLLFPFFERHGPDSAKRTNEIMREGHQRIRHGLDALLAKADAGDPELTDSETTLRNALWAHNALEERRLYPWFDKEMPPAEGSVLASMIRDRLRPLATDPHPST
ncbi:MAG: hemerythrin domain-containing protein [Thermoplasmata archaeon]